MLHKARILDCSYSRRWCSPLLPSPMLYATSALVQTILLVYLSLFHYMRLSLVGQMAMIVILLLLIVLADRSPGIS